MAATQKTRKPVDLKLRHGYQTHRDAIWSAIRELRTFTVMDIEAWVNKRRRSIAVDVIRRVNANTIRTYVRGLTCAGYLAEIEGERRSDDTHGRYIRKRWELINDTGVDVPRVTRDGVEVTQGLSRRMMWKAMKILGEFTLDDLVATASAGKVAVKREDAKDYVRHLVNAEYVMRLELNPPRATRYQFIASRNSGPLAPMVQRVKQVFDPNLNKVVWPKGDES